jgi:hypothetical protein
MADRKEMDVVADLAYPLPVAVICDLLAVPDEDRDALRRWSLDLIHTIAPIIPPDALARAQRAGREFRAYLSELIEARRRRPGEDLLSGLIHAEDQGEQLTEAELVSTCVLLLIAGHETTLGLIGNGTLALLRNAGELRRLHDDRSLKRTAIEELLRYDSAVQLTGRLSPGTRRSTDTRSTRARTSWPWWVRRTETQSSSRTRTGWTSVALTTATWRSAAASTSAWERTWLASRAGSPSQSLPAGSRIWSRGPMWLNGATPSRRAD